MKPKPTTKMESEITKAAAALGKKGGSVKSEAKTKAAKANGSRGGRPVKIFRAGNITVKSLYLLAERVQSIAESAERSDITPDAAAGMLNRAISAAAIYTR